ncbi:putative DNA-binding transcriptional regulator YafY [Achromobacter deleyi]|uniref:helix-turn-helix transcriptional regulator n=1 Tax=Achromobacter deleyi TaxID=1353891 RepID=UPI002855207D|nr:YafY family protein [Achromobacter deleyi]MDR6603637.1 putative DNA-binding transcriptional regulator YafY [Achromobacter deleyi]
MLSSSNRLLRLLSLLQTRRHWAGADLAQTLAVHPRTLRRDIDRLRELGYPIQASSGVAGGYSFRAGNALPPLLLDDDEALTVAITLRTAATGTVGGVEEAALRALVKLEQVMPTRLRHKLDALRSAIVPLPRGGPVIDAGLLAALAAACRDQLRVNFDYADSRGQPSTRQVEPQGLAHTGYRWYLVAWDPARDDWRTFRLDRIAGAVALGAHFAPRPPPEGGDLRAYVMRAVGQAPNAEEARIVLHAPHGVMAARIPASAGQVEALDDGRCLLRSSGQSLEALTYWLLALEVEFDVLAPASLAQRFQAAGERVARMLQRRDTATPPQQAERPEPPQGSAT